MKRMIPVLAYTAATLTMAAAILTPFVLYPVFTKAIGSLNVHVDDVYSGGQVAFTLARPGYEILVGKPVTPKALLPEVSSFVQVSWTPVSALPQKVSDEVDVDGDGVPDLRAAFVVPEDPNARMRVDVTPLSSKVAAMRGVGQDSFASLIARLNDRIVVRVPLREQ